MSASHDIVIVERRIKARPHTVYSFFTDRDRWLSWQGVQAEIDPRPGVGRPCFGDLFVGFDAFVELADERQANGVQTQALCSRQARLVWETFGQAQQLTIRSTLVVQLSPRFCEQ